MFGKVLVDSSLCTGEKPETEQMCNDEPCPAKWIVGNWSEVGDWVYSIVMKDAFFSVGDIGVRARLDLEKAEILYVVRK